MDEPPAAMPTRHVTSGGVRVYRLPVPAYPHLPANAYLTVHGDPGRPEYTALIDVGSDHADSTAALDAGLAAVRADFGEICSWDTLSRIVVTHPHPDHVAGLPFVRRRTAAPVAAFHSAVPTIERPHEQRDAHVAGIGAQLTWAGVPLDSPYAARLRRRAGNLALPSGVPVDTPMHDGDVLDGLLTVIHTPGHEGSQVCLRVDDVLLSADHVLPHNSPPLMPERTQPGAGLAHYLASLDRVEALDGVRLALGGHNGPMLEWRGRILQLRTRYADKLASVLDAAREPISVHDLTHTLFPRLNPVQALLLLDQTGALAEDAAARGDLRYTERNDGAALFQRA